MNVLQEVGWSSNNVFNDHPKRATSYRRSSKFWTPPSPKPGTWQQHEGRSSSKKKKSSANPPTTDHTSSLLES